LFERVRPNNQIKYKLSLCLIPKIPPHLPLVYLGSCVLSLVEGLVVLLQRPLGILLVNVRLHFGQLLFVILPKN